MATRFSALKRFLGSVGVIEGGGGGQESGMYCAQAGMAVASPRPCFALTVALEGKGLDWRDWRVQGGGGQGSECAGAFSPAWA